MARQLRIEYDGALYHVMSRGNEQREIILGDEDRFSFLDCLREMSDRFEVDIFAYVLMDNHYHMLLRTNKANLSKSMQWLGTTYTRRFNLRHSRSGHLFQGRFKGILVESDAYMMQLSCYIHRNPLRAGIVGRLADYRWSSYPAYAYKKKHQDGLDTDFILSQFNVKDKHKAYREKVQRYSDEKNRIWENVRHGLIYGTQNFIDRIKSDYLSNKPNTDIPQHNRLLRDEDPCALLNKAAAILNCKIADLKGCPRVAAADKDKRDIMIYLLWETGKYTNMRIGNLFGLTYSSISRRVNITKSRIAGGDQIRGRYQLLKSQIKV